MSEALQIQHPDYAERSMQIAYARDHYECKVLEKAYQHKGSATANPSTNTAYLYRYVQGEPDYEYQARVNISDYTPHFSFAVNSTAGQIFPLEAEAERSWGLSSDSGIQGLGDPKSEDSVMHRLWGNIDGQGTNYPTLFRQLAPKLVYANMWGMLVEGSDKEYDEARVILISPTDVLDWGDGWVKIRHYDYKRDDWRTKAERRTLYTVYTLDGWTRYERGEDGKDVEIESGTHAYYESGRKKRKMLPFRMFEVPLDLPIGYIMAQKANAIFNQESARDWSMFKARFPKLAIHPDIDLTDEQIEKRLKEGYTWFKAPSLQYSSPDVAGVSAGTDVLEHKEINFYRTFFRSYEDSARLKTATEVIQDNRSGAESYLGMLKTTLDEAENFALLMLEQIYFPNNPSLWGTATVERSDNFQPMDPDKMAEKLTGRWIEKRLPLGPTGVENVLKKVAELDGVQYDEVEMQKEIEEWLANPPASVNDLGAVDMRRMTPRAADRATALREQVERMQLNGGAT